MNQLNNVLLEGILVNDPEVVAESPATKSKLVKFTLANDRYYKDKNGETKQDTLFISVQCWGSLGEKCMNAVRKGMSIRCVGRLMTCRWETKDGNKRSTTEIVCTHLEYKTKSKNSEPKVQTIEDDQHESEMLSDETVVLYELW